MDSAGFTGNGKRLVLLRNCANENHEDHLSFNRFKTETSAKVYSVSVYVKQLEPAFSMETLGGKSLRSKKIKCLKKKYALVT